MGVAVKVDLTRTSLPAEVKKRPFHPGMRDPTLSTRGCRSTFLSFLIWRGMPRYLHGNDFLFPGKESKTLSRSTSEQRIGKTSAKKERILLSAVNSSDVGFAKMATSSA